MACPFCNIGSDRVVREYDHVIVIISDPWLVQGHMLVIPKRHVERLSELDETERGEMSAAIS